MCRLYANSYVYYVSINIYSYNFALIHTIYNYNIYIYNSYNTNNLTSIYTIYLVIYLFNDYILI